MTPALKAQLKTKVLDLMREGKALLETRYQKAGHNIVDRKSDGWVDPQYLEKWVAGCTNLFRLVGSGAKSWRDTFSAASSNTYLNAVRLAGSLAAFSEAIDQDLLTSLEDLVTAFAFGSLLEQAEELLDKNYSLAAGILGRAVLEEHLRTKCDRNGLLPPGKPTINDLNQALYKGGIYDKLVMQRVTAMATAGNHCAHNLTPPLTHADVRQLLVDVRDFLIRNPL